MVREQKAQTNRKRGEDRPGRSRTRPQARGERHETQAPPTNQALRAGRDRGESLGGAQGGHARQQSRTTNSRRRLTGRMSLLVSVLGMLVFFGGAQAASAGKATLATNINNGSSSTGPTTGNLNGCPGDIIYLQGASSLNRHHDPTHFGLTKASKNSSSTIRLKKNSRPMWFTSDTWRGRSCGECRRDGEKKGKKRQKKPNRSFHSSSRYGKARKATRRVDGPGTVRFEGGGTTFPFKFTNLYKCFGRGGGTGGSGTTGATGPTGPTKERPDPDRPAPRARPVKQVSKDRPARPERPARPVNKAIKDRPERPA